MSLRLTKLWDDFVQRIILLNATKLFAIANFQNLPDISVYRICDIIQNYTWKYAHLMLVWFEFEIE